MSYSGNGAQGRDRTTDTAIFSRMLYQLSYLGTARRGARERRFIVRLACPVHHASPSATHGAASLRPSSQITGKPRLFCTKVVTVLGVMARIDSQRLKSTFRPRRQFRGQFSTLILASRITGPHLSISDFRKAASSACVEPFGVAPSSSNRDLTWG